MSGRAVTLFTILVVATTACGEDAAPVDRPPTIEDAEVVVEEDTSVTVTLSADDPDGDPVSVTVTPPTNGTLVQDGLTVTYTPAPDFHGEEALTVTATAGARTATAMLRIRVTPVNDAPDALDDVLSATEDAVATIAAAALLANDTDADGDPLASALAV